MWKLSTSGGNLGFLIRILSISMLMQYSQAGKASKMRCHKDSRNLSMDMQEITWRNDFT
jgi:hypothetical protein